MAHNYLEQLVAEWYEYKGYFVRRNVKVGPRKNGGYECELDVVAFHPDTKHVIHIEPSMDSSSWKERERRYTKKFKAGKVYIPKIFTGMNNPSNIDQVALFVFASKTNRATLAGGQIWLLKDLLVKIFTEIADTSIHRNVIPEQFIVLRSFQFVAEYRAEVTRALNS